MQSRTSKESKIKALVVFLVITAGTFAIYRHMSQFPTPGQVGVLSTEDELYEQRLRAQRLSGSVEWMCNEIGRRSSRWSVRSHEFKEGLEDSLIQNGFLLEDHKYEIGQALFHNTVGVRKGSGAGTILIGTHHDSYGKSPCANASATGVATLMELAREFRDESFDPTVIIAFFGTGEEPHAGRATMGAKIWLDAQKEAGRQIDAAYIVGSFGCFRSSEEGQNSAFPWYLSHPKSSDWLGVYGDFMGREVVTDTLAAWARVSDLPARGFAAPGWMLGVAKRDQIPFQKEGIPCVLLSDTGLNRDPSLRQEFDVAAGINYPEMARRVEALGLMLKDIINSTNETTLAKAR